MARRDVGERRTRPTDSCHPLSCPFCSLREAEWRHRNRSVSPCAGCYNQYGSSGSRLPCGIAALICCGREALHPKRRKPFAGTSVLKSSTVTANRVSGASVAIGKLTWNDVDHLTLPRGRGGSMSVSGIDLDVTCSKGSDHLTFADMIAARRACGRLTSRAPVGR